MADKYDVTVNVISQKGHCVRGHNVGDEWIIKDSKIPAGICIDAFGSILQYIQALRYGGTFPWEKDPGVTEIACPDGKNPVIFELRRLKK